MTKSEYERLFVEARKSAANLSLKAQIHVKLAYKRAAATLAKELKANIDKGYSSITINQQTALLSAISNILGDDIQDITTGLVESTSKIYTNIDKAFLLEAMPGFSTEAIEGIFVKINNQAVQNMVTRIYSDGYNFSRRIWKTREGFENRIKDIITSGLAQGRDPVKLIKDIEIYVDGGRAALAKRWGDLEAGDTNWKKRIRGDIDSSAQRLVRSEIMATMQSISIQSGEANPAATGEYTWVLGPGLAHCADCIDYSAQIFTKDTIPDYPHPNCGCQIRPVLRDHDVFVNDLENFVNGNITEENKYLEIWTQQYYNAT